LYFTNVFDNSFDTIDNKTGEETVLDTTDTFKGGSPESVTADIV